MSRCKPEMDMSGLDNALGDLVAAQLSLGRELLGVLATGGGQLIDSALGMQLPKGTSCCDIPEPCWMPKSLGEVACTLCPGDVGEVCLTVVNEDFRPRAFEVVPAGADAGAVQVRAQDKSFTLGPKERRIVAVRVVMPLPKDDDNREESCCDCGELDILLWVKGCNSHYLRWVLCRGEKKSSSCCHHVEVHDQPDYELHWYDHFHIMRPCPPALKT